MHPRALRQGVTSGVSAADAGRFADELAALRRVAGLVSSGASQADILDGVVVEASRLLGVEHFLMAKFDTDGSTLIVAQHGEGLGRRVGDLDPPGGDGVLQQVRLTGRLTRVDNYGGLEGYAPAVARTIGVSAGAAAGIVVDGRLWGALGAFGRGRPLPVGVEHRLQHFADLVATAVSGAHARSRLGDLMREQVALRRVAELVAHGVAADDLFAVVAVEASALVGDEAVTLLRIDHDRAYTVVASHRGPAPTGTRIEVDTGDAGVVAEIMRTGRPARRNDYRSHRGRAFANSDYGVGSSVGVPVVVGDVLWGVLGVTTSPGRQVPAAAEDTLVHFADLVAAAVANREAHAQVQALADEQAALRHVADLVVRGASLDEVFVAVAAEASGLLGGIASGLWRLEDDDCFVLVAKANRELPVGFRAEPYPGTPFGDLLRTGAPARMENLEGTPLADVARQLGVSPTVAVPVTVEGRLWGAMTATTGEARSADDVERRLLQFAELAGAAIANAENKAKLIASRARVVATADETRRRLQRDVHDSAQQRLVHTVIALKLARQAIAAGADADALVEEALTNAERANSELGDIVRGILPAALTRGGLRAGLQSLLADLVLPVDLRVTAPRCSPHTELTAYFVIAEALTNVVKHAKATRASVVVDVSEDMLAVEVRDDGVGGADPVRGTGLVGLVDRVDAVGGSLTLTSPPGQGTTIHLRLPLWEASKPADPGPGDRR